MVVLNQNPESTRTTISPEAPARRTRAISSSTKRLVPRAHAGVDHLAGVGPGGQQGVVAQHLGVAEGGPGLSGPATRRWWSCRRR
jgi:hypothetical protein